MDVVCVGNCNICADLMGKKGKRRLLVERKVQFAELPPIFEVPLLMENMCISWNLRVVLGRAGEKENGGRC